MALVRQKFRVGEKKPTCQNRAQQADASSTIEPMVMAMQVTFWTRETDGVLDSHSVKAFKDSDVIVSSTKPAEPL